MRVFVAGASGVLGRRVAKTLKELGHHVVGTAYTRPEIVEETGVEVAILDALDADALSSAVKEAKPDVVIHALTRIPHAALPTPGRLKENNLLRTKGTANLITASNAAGVERLIAESITFAFIGRREQRMRPYKGMGRFQSTVDSVVELEAQVLKIGGIVLRFGYFYGPGTSVDEKFPQALRRRTLPIVGKGTGWWSYVHIDDAASAVIAAIDKAEPGETYNIVDDEPILARDALRVVSETTGAPRAIKLPVGPPYAKGIFDESTGAINDKARSALDWAPRYPKFEEGFPATYSRG